MPSSAPNPSDFDAFAGDYDAALNKGISLSGEGKDFFIEGRLRFLRRCLGKDGATPRRILDYGCGTGSAFPKLREILGGSEIIGVDVSTAELTIAQKQFPWAKTFTPSDTPGDVAADLAYSNGTFHHIPPDQRQDALRFIYDRLKPGGLFALWENNPWNPGTRWVMSRIPFDKDAIMLSAIEARRRVREAGFTVLRTDFLFIFPRMLAPLRPLERLVTRLPLGAQYQILARK